MKGNTIITDTELKMDVLAELRYEPSVRITDIGVLVKDGAVTLNGYATTERSPLRQQIKSTGPRPFPEVPLR